MEGLEAPRRSGATPTAESLLRPHWHALTERLWADLVTDKLYELKIISRRDKSKIESNFKQDRYDGAALLLEIMLTRSWSQCVEFAKILTHTTGIQDLGQLLVEDAGIDHVMDYRDRTTKASESKQLRKLTVDLKEENELVAKYESLAQYNKQSESDKKGERLQRLALELKLDEQVKRSVVTQCKWERWGQLPRGGRYLGSVATVHHKVIAADNKHNRFYICDVRSSPVTWYTVENTYSKTGGVVDRVFNAENECFCTFHKTAAGGEQIIAKYAEFKNEWQHVMDLPSFDQLYNYVVTADRHHVYIVGNNDGGNVGDTLLVYDINTGTQCGRAKMGRKRCDCSCTIIENMLYVGGGSDGVNYLNSIDCISVSDYRSHHGIAATPSFCCSLSSYCGQLVMSGGRNGEDFVSTATNIVSVWAPSRNEWRPLPAMNEQRFGHGMCTVDDDTVVVVGGLDIELSFSDRSSVEILNIPPWSFDSQPKYGEGGATVYKPGDSICRQPWYTPPYLLGSSKGEDTLLVRCHGVSQSLELSLCFCDRNQYRLGSPEFFKLIVENCGDHSVEAQEIILEEDTYRHQLILQLPSIKPNEVVAINFTTKVKERSIRKLPQQLSFVLKRTKYRKNFISSGLGCYNRGLEDFKPRSSSSRVFNLLLFGIAGATKSSFLNTVATMLKRDDGAYNNVERPAGYGGGADHTTTALHCYMLSQLYNVSFNMWDTWGLARDTYQDAKLVEMLVDGRLPKEWKMTDSLSQHRARFQETTHTRLKRPMHGILFFIPHMFINEIDEDEQQRVKNIFQILIKKRYSPIIVVSKVDEMHRELREHPFRNRHMVNDFRRQVADIFAIPSNNVRYTVNYLEEKERSFEIECLAYETMQQALESCQSFEDACFAQ